MLLILSLLLLIFQLFCVLIPIIDKRKNSGKNEIKYSNWEKALITFSILAFGLSIAVILVSQDSEKEKENQADTYQIDLKNKLAERDSIHQRSDSIQTYFFIERLDSSYSKSIRASNEALAKYNLELVDSLNRVTNKINNKSINKPQFSVAPAEAGTTPPMHLTKEENENYLAVKFISTNNVSYNIKIRFCILKCAFENKHIIYSALDTVAPFYDKKFLIQNVFSTALIPIKPEFLQMENSIIFFTGTFSSDEANKDVSHFEDAYFYDLKNNKQNSPLDASLLLDIKSKLQKKGILK